MRRLQRQALAVALCLVCTFVVAEDPPADTIQAFRVLQAEGVKAVAEKEKKQNAKKKEDKKAKKAKVPEGYEDVPEAGEPPPPREDVIMVEAIEEEEVEEAAVFGEVEAILAQNVDANVVNLERQFTAQFKALMTAELSFINRTCDLKLEQRKKIKAVSDKCLKAAVRKYAKTQNGLMRGGWGGRNQPTMPDPTQLLHQSMAGLLKETLQPDQKKRYDEEMAHRQAVRKRVSVVNVVAIIDEHLVLTIDQRKKLTELLDKNWQASWVQSIEMLLNNNQYMPSIPDRFVTPVLNETQKKVWRAAQKQNYMVWGGFGWGQQVAAVDDFPLEDVVAADEAR